MTNEVNLFIFRHGITNWNLEERIQGRTDIPLNAQGIDQAEELAKCLEPFEIEQIVSSPLSRAAQTAFTVANALKIDVTMISDLTEVFFGDAEGRTKSELVAENGEDFWERWRSVEPQDLLFRFLNGESKIEARTRAITALEKFVTANTQVSKLGVSTHGGVLRYIVNGLLPQSEMPVPVPNCACYVIKYCRQRKIWSFMNRLN